MKRRGLKQHKPPVDVNHILRRLATPQRLGLFIVSASNKNFYFLLAFNNLCNSCFFSSESFKGETHQLRLTFDFGSRLMQRMVQGYGRSPYERKPLEFPF
jgi:hypothetical protein